jgi:hypothetical protein
MNERICYALQRPDGYILIDTFCTTELKAWEIHLSYPDDEEIEEAKKEGYKVIKVKITEIPVEEE